MKNKPAQKASERVEAILGLLLKLARGDLDARLEPSDAEDELDGIIHGLNMLAEELSYSTFSKEYVDNIINSMLEMLIVTDNYGIINKVCHSACEILGYKENDLNNKHIESLFPKDEFFFSKLIQDELIKKGFIQYPEKSIITKTGVKIPVSLSVSVVRNKRGDLEGFVFLMNDITERKQAEETIKKSHGELQKLTAHLHTVREEERAIVAGEIHDEIGQALTALKMDIYSLKNKMPEVHGEMPDTVKSMDKLLDDTIQVTRRIYTELRPSLLEHLGLEEKIEAQVDKFQKLTGIKSVLEIDISGHKLNDDYSVALFRIIQETLNNVRWHSNASEVKVQLIKKQNQMELKIIDNGIGINEEKYNNINSIGLIGMKERAKYLGSELEIKGIRDKGTTVRVRIPVA